MLAKWHLAMPVLTACLGYFGRRLGWLEDTPRGVVRDWSFMGPRFEARGAPADGTDPRVATMAAVTAPILALSVTDDEFGTEAAIDRLLAYYTGSARPICGFRRLRWAWRRSAISPSSTSVSATRSGRSRWAGSRAGSGRCRRLPYAVTARRLYPVVRVFAREEFGAQMPARRAAAGADRPRSRPGCCRRHARSRRSPNA